MRLNKFCNYEVIYSVNNVLQLQIPHVDTRKKPKAELVTKKKKMDRIFNRN